MEILIIKMLNKNLNLNQNVFENNVELKSVRQGFGDGLIELGEKHDDVVVLTADLAESTGVKPFAEKFSNRFCEVGVAEQNLVTVASGIANYGKVPFASSYAAFSPGRNWEQIRTTVCINDVPVKIVSTHYGISAGEDGATHQSLEDLALMRVLPNIIIYSPADYYQAKKVVFAAYENKKPTYIRLPRVNLEVITTENTNFESGKMQIIWEEKSPEIAIFSIGNMLYPSLIASKNLSQNGISNILVNVHTVKPLDEDLIIKMARQTGTLLTVEDHQIIGGLGGAVAEVVSKNFPVPVEIMGIDDQFGQSGNYKDLYKFYKLTSDDIIKRAHTALARKKYE